MNHFEFQSPVFRVAPIFLLAAALVFADDDYLSGYAPQLAEAYLNQNILEETPGELSPEQAKTVQRMFLEATEEAPNAGAGYKAALTNPAVQQKFGVNHPLRGTLFPHMLYPSGSEIPARLGARPMIEGDLIVRVGDDAINTAEDADQIAACLDAVLPFIELPDLLFSTNASLTASWIVAMNTGARAGILGEPVPFPAGESRSAHLNSIRVRLENEGGTLLAEGSADSLLGDPLNAVRWLRDSLKADGAKLKKGDLLSLGSMTRLLPVQPGTTITARYFNLDPGGPVEISVKFGP